MQRERRNNPYPWTWEIPIAVACGVLLLLAVGVHLGDGLAHLTAGHGWTWPPTSRLFTSIPTTLTTARHESNGWAWIVSVELLLCVGLCGLGVVGWRRWGPSRLKGLATRDQAEQVLGVTRLKKVAPIIRPDLHHRRRILGGRR